MWGECGVGGGHWWCLIFGAKQTRPRSWYLRKLEHMYSYCHLAGEVSDSRDLETRVSKFQVHQTPGHVTPLLSDEVNTVRGYYI